MGAWGVARGWGSTLRIHEGKLEADFHPEVFKGKSEVGVHPERFVGKSLRWVFTPSVHREKLEVGFEEKLGVASDPRGKA